VAVSRQSAIDSIVRMNRRDLALQRIHLQIRTHQPHDRPSYIISVFVFATKTSRLCSIDRSPQSARSVRDGGENVAFIAEHESNIGLARINAALPQRAPKPLASEGLSTIRPS
jgi:hypothetical protein